MNFDAAFAQVIDHEGGFQRDPRDRGNWTSGKIGKGELKGTKYGISAMAYPNEDIKHLTIDRAKELYYRDYWLKLQLDALPDSIRFDMFDMAVNSGPKQAIRILQRAVSEVADGVVGARTIAACGLLDPQVLDKRLNAQRLLFLTEIETWPAFGAGWVRRVAHNLLKD